MASDFAPVQPQYLNLGQILGQVEDVKSSRMQQQLFQQRMQGMQREQARMDQLRGLYRGPKPPTPEQISALDPEFGYKVRNQQIDAQNAGSVQQQGDHKLFKDAAVGAMTRWKATGNNPEMWPAIMHDVRRQLQMATGGRLGADESIEKFTPEMVSQFAAYEDPDVSMRREAKAEAMKAGAIANAKLPAEKAMLDFKLENGSGGDPYYSPQYDEKGNAYGFNHRTGKVEPVTGPDGTPFRGARYSPDLERDVNKGKAAGTEEGKVLGQATAKQEGYEKKASGLAILKAVESFGGEQKIKDLIAESTGSTLGMVRDAGARAVGSTTGGMEGIAKLKPFASALTNMQPRFEGPQSDADRRAYEEAAGRIAAPESTDKEKLAAFGTVLELAKKYAKIVRRSKRTGAVQHSMDGGATWVDGEP